MFGNSSEDDIKEGATIIEKPPLSEGDQVFIDPPDPSYTDPDDPPIRLHGHITSIETERHIETGDSYYAIHCDVEGVLFHWEEQTGWAHNRQVLDMYGPTYTIEWPDLQDHIQTVAEADLTPTQRQRDPTASGDDSSEGSSSDSSDSSTNHSNSDMEEDGGDGNGRPAADFSQTEDIRITYLDVDGEWTHQMFNSVVNLVPERGPGGEPWHTIRGVRPESAAEGDIVLKRVVRVLSGDESSKLEEPLPRPNEQPPSEMTTRNPTAAQVEAWKQGQRQVDNPYR